MEQQQQTITESETGMRLDRWIRVHYGAVPQSMIEKWARTGGLRLDGKKAKAATRIVTGQEVQLPLFVEQKFTKPPVLTPKIAAKDQELLHRAVIAQDEHVIVFNKPPGLAVQGGSKTTRHLDAMLESFREEGGERPRLVHRLDKDTSGVLLVARQRQAAQWLTQAFKEQAIKKTYWAIVVGVPEQPQGIIDIPIIKKNARKGEGAQAAQTSYRVLQTKNQAKNQDFAWIELTPHTGRTHQLRIHCAHLGTPVLGDDKYGSAQAHSITQQYFPHDLKHALKLHLHAQKIIVPYPDGQPRTFVADLPMHMRQVFEKWGFFEKI